MEGIDDLMIGETIPRDFGTVMIMCYNRGTERVVSTPPAPLVPHPPFVPLAESLGGSSRKIRLSSVLPPSTTS